MAWKQTLEIPKEEKIVSTITYGGYYYWDFKFPFRHYKEPRLYIATETAIYTYDHTPINNKDNLK